MGVGVLERGAKSRGVTAVEEDHQADQEEASDFAAWGLLRIEARLWLLASDLDGEEVVRPRGF